MLFCRARSVKRGAKGFAEMQKKSLFKNSRVMYTYVIANFVQDSLARGEGLDALEVQLDALGGVLLDHALEEMLERQIALVGRWMRHYRDLAVVHGAVQFAQNDVGFQHHDVVFKKENRDCGRACVTACGEK